MNIDSTGWSMSRRGVSGGKTRGDVGSWSCRKVEPSYGDIGYERKHLADIVTFVVRRGRVYVKPTGNGIVQHISSDESATSASQESELVLPVIMGVSRS